MIPSLERDLQDLQQAVPRIALEPGHSVEFPTAAVLGALYVLEGSALGAQLLTRRAQSIGMTADFGARHMFHQTSRAGAWRQFVEILDAADLTPDAEIACRQAALTAFTTFETAYAAACDSEHRHAG